MSLSRTLARPMIAAMFVTGGVHALRNTDEFAERAKPAADKLVPQAKKAVPQIPDDTATLVRINAGVQIVAAAALATGRLPRLSAAALAASLVPTTLASHSFWEISDPEEKDKQKLHFFKNLAILGGLVIAAGDTDGKPNVAYRAKAAARHGRRDAALAAKAARREAALVATSARREAKLAKANLT